MSTGRRLFGACTLDGYAYAVGGRVAGDASNTAEKYDPSSNTWSDIASMSAGRQGLGVVALGGKVYAIGPDETAEAYDPSSNKWGGIAPMSTQRFFLAVGTLGGKIYAVGGVTDAGFLTSAEAYSPTTDSWSAIAAMSQARNSLAVGVLGGKVYAVGGSTDTAGYLKVVEAYDPASNKWSTVANMTAARANPAVAVIGARMYAIGGFGYSAEVYDATSSKWATITNIPGPAAGELDGPAVAVLGDKIFAMGGTDDGNMTSAEVYNPTVVYSCNTTTAECSASIDGTQTQATCTGTCKALFRCDSAHGTAEHGICVPGGTQTSLQCYDSCKCIGLQNCGAQTNGTVQCGVVVPQGEAGCNVCPACCRTELSVVQCKSCVAQKCQPSWI
jgi:N-acetylneuraminic acid mutarotase